MVKPGLLRNVRRAKRMSCSADSTHCVPRASRQSSLSCSIPPNLRMALRRASSTATPDSRFSCCRSSRCRRISSSNSTSSRGLRHNMPIRRTSSPGQLMDTPSLGRLDHARDGPDYSFKLRDFGRQLFAACRRELVVAGAAIASGCTPLCRHPSLDEHPLQRGIQRTLLHLKNVILNNLHQICNLKPVHLPEPVQRFQDQKVQGSRRNLISTQDITSWHS